MTRQQSNGSRKAPTPTGSVVGYARVSTEGQSLDFQLDALKAAGAATVYREKISGVRSDRPQLAKLMASLRKGDVVLVTKLDRLGRSTRELLDLIHRIDQGVHPSSRWAIPSSTPQARKAACWSPCSRPSRNSSVNSSANAPEKGVSGQPARGVGGRREDDAERAVRAGLELIQAVGRVGDLMPSLQMGSSGPG